MNWPTDPLEFVGEYLVHLHWALGHELFIISVGRLLATCGELKVLIYRRLRLLCERGWELLGQQMRQAMYFRSAFVYEVFQVLT